MAGASTEDGYGGGRGRIAPVARTFLIGVAIVALVILLTTLFLPSSGGRPVASNNGGGGFCPRPPQAFVAVPQFNQQAIEIHALRRHAFRNVFFAQLELARRYEGGRATDKKLEDPVEAATWYAVALANASGFDPVGGSSATRATSNGRAAEHYDECRANERRDAYRHLDILLARMSTEERDKVRRRAIYVLSTMGADGFRTLARLHDAAYGPYGEPSDNREAHWSISREGAATATNLFQRNDVDAYLFNYLAAQTGDVAAFVLLKDSVKEYERASPERGGFANMVESKANRWVPPYEFYPPEAPDSGVPLSDESEPNSDSAEAALLRLCRLPTSELIDALAYLRLMDRSAAHPTESHCGAGHGLFAPQQAIETFQAMLGQEKTGALSPLQKVRLIQYAASSGSPKAQLALAVMYSEGVGVPVDYARAYHWYETADKQGSPEAKYAMSTFFSLGLDGVTDQDKAKAVAYQIDAALSGFGPSTDRLREILQRMGHAHPKVERDTQ